MKKVSLLLKSTSVVNNLGLELTLSEIKWLKYLKCQK